MARISALSAQFQGTRGTKFGRNRVVNSRGGLRRGHQGSRVPACRSPGPSTVSRCVSGMAVQARHRRLALIMGRGFVVFLWEGVVTASLTRGGLKSSK